METFEHRYSTVLFIAQRGPKDDKPFFGFVNLKTTWAEWEAKLHYRIAELVALEQGCSAPIVCCDTEDMPEFFKQGIGGTGSGDKLKGFVFAAEPHHYEQARKLVDTMTQNSEAKEAPATRFTVRTETYDDGKCITVIAHHLPNALHRAASLIDGFTLSSVTGVFVGNTIGTDEQGNEILIYAVRVEYERNE